MNMENQLAFTTAVRQALAEMPNEYDPRRYLGPARDAVKQAVRTKIRLFGASGKMKG